MRPRKVALIFGGVTRIRTGGRGVADLCLTTWLWRHIFHLNDSYGNRTRVTAVKGRCLDRLTKEPYALYLRTKTPPVGLEPTTTRLTAECSTD